MIHNWNLLLVEKGLAIALGLDDTPSTAYRLAAQYCEHYDPHYGNCLNGPSGNKILELVRFINSLEALEDEGTFNSAEP